MLHDVTDDEKREIYEEFGKPPVRDEPLDVQEHNFVLFCNIGGPIYDVERGRVFDIVDSVEAARAGHGGPAGHDGVLATGDGLDGRYVNVRTGPATMEYAWVPIEYVLRIEAPGCEYVGGEGYQPLDQRVDGLGNVLD